MYDLPAVVLTVRDDGGKLSGTILFYFLHRNTEHDPWQVDTTALDSLASDQPKVRWEDNLYSKSATRRPIPLGRSMTRLHPSRCGLPERARRSC